MLPRHAKGCQRARARTRNPPPVTTRSSATNPARVQSELEVVLVDGRLETVVLVRVDDVPLVPDWVPLTLVPVLAVVPVLAFVVPLVPTSALPEVPLVAGMPA